MIGIEPWFDETRASPRRDEPDRESERSLLHLLEQHRSAEGAILERYRDLAERDSVDDAIRYLVGMILEDEERHHEAFGRMANEMRSFLWEFDVEPSLPVLREHADPELLAETERLLAFEKQDAKELRRLRRELRATSKSSLDPLMVELMLHDTAKHIAILEHIEARLAA